MKYTLPALLEVADNLHDAWISDLSVDQTKSKIVLNINGLECLDGADARCERSGQFRAKIIFKKATLTSRIPARDYMDKEIIRCFFGENRMEIVTIIGNFSIDFDESAVEIMGQP